MELDSAAQIVCPKCNHRNEPKAEHCAQCQGHLYVQCRSCGEKNPRSSKQCAECGAELHRPKRKRREHEVRFHSDAWKYVLAVALVLLSIIAWFVLRGSLFQRPL